MSRKRVLLGLPTLLTLAAIGLAGAGGATAGAASGGSSATSTNTPIKHVVVIFQENVSFDHYFGTYPNAANTDGQQFNARPGTPAVDGLLPATNPSLPASLQHSSNLTTTNPNADLPQRLDSSPDRCRRQPRRSVDLRPGSQLFRRAAVVRRIQDGPVRAERRQRWRHITVRNAVHRGHRDGLLRRQHHHGPLELRPAVCDGRQLLQPDVRTVLAGRDQPGLRRHGQRGHDSHGKRPVDVDVVITQRRPDGGRPGRLLVDQRRPAVLGRLLDTRRRRDERVPISATS